MSKKSKLQLFVGILVLSIVGATLIVYMNYANSLLGSTTAVLKANAFTVGTDYAGTVTQQFVQVGDHVDAGQKLFYIKSATLTQALNSNQLQKNDLVSSLTADGQLVIAAGSKGVVSAINYGKGSYVARW